MPSGLVFGMTTGVILGTPTSSGTASFTMRVTDANGLTDTKALSITVSATVILWAPVIGDSYVRADVPAGSYGGEQDVWTGLVPTQSRALIKFDLSAVPAGSTVVYAILRLYVTNVGFAGTAGLCEASKSWAESNVTWSLAVNPVPPCASASAPPSRGQWWELDVISIVRPWITNGGNWGRGFVIDLVAGIMSFASRESGNAPQLYIQYGR